jgi:protein SCO1
LTTPAPGTIAARLPGGCMRQENGGWPCLRRPRAGLLWALVAVGACTRPSAGVELAPREVPDIEARAVDGREFRLSDYRGSVVVLTFGYTSCPDVCPLTLSRLRGLMARLGPQAEQVASVFVSVDPERDTAERLGAYLDAFDRRIRGLSLAQPQLQPVLTAFGVTATRRMADARRYRNHALGGEAPYSIDHTAGFFVIDRQGQLRLRFPHEVQVDDMVPHVAELLAEGGAR